MAWTEKQQRAIDLENKNILVSASAGSGKTAVLSERIVKLCLKNKIDIDKFVVVTFTRLAANEMKGRILKKLEEAKETFDDQTFIDEQMLLIERANISTLDSLNVSILRDYFYMIDIEPNFGIMEQVDLEILKRKVLDSIFDKYYEEKNESFINLLSMYSKFRDDLGLKMQIMLIYSYAINLPNPKKALDDLRLIYSEDENVDVNTTKFYDYFKQSECKILDELLDEAKDYLYVSDVLESEYNQAQELLKAIGESYEKAREVALKIEFDKFTTKEKNMPDKDKAKKIRDDLKSEITKLQDKYLALSKSELEDKMHEMSREINLLIDITDEFSNKLFEEKKKLNRYDFNDLSHLVIDLLYDKDGNFTPLALELKSIYKYIIVDEYQDVNEIQETILRALARYEIDESNMFMVGDVKQSIYRFRKADPEIFTNKYNMYKENKDVRNEKIDLNQNFRSRVEVLDSINFIFDKLMIKEVGNIEYDDDMALKCGNLYALELDEDYRTEVGLIKYKDVKKGLIEENKTDESYDPEILSELIEGIKKDEIEAEYVVSRIKEMVDKSYKVYDVKKKEYRNIRYSDISILFRGLSQKGPIYYRKLKNAGIPAVMSNKDNFLSEIEVQLVISMLKLIDNPYDDVAQVTMLYSEQFEFSCEDLMLLRKRNKNVPSFYEIITRELGNIEGNENNEELEPIDSSLLLKIKKFINTYNHLKDFAKANSLYELIKEIYIVSQEEKYFLGQIEMKSKQSNMEAFFDFSKRYEQIGSKNIYDFIMCIDQILEMETKMEPKSDMDSGDAVNIMTIHKSKGLEFNVVFMPSLDKNVNRTDTTSKILLDKSLGFATKYINVKKAYQTTNFYYEVMKDKIWQDNLAEEMRILYVALTRAKEKLILVSAIDKDPETEGLMKGNKLKYNTIMHLGKMIDFILPQIMLKDAEKYFDVKIISSMDMNIKEIVEQKSLVSTLFDEVNNDNTNDNSNNDNTTYIYPYIDSTKIKQKISVTELKKLINDRNSQTKDNESNGNNQIDFEEKAEDDGMYYKDENSSKIGTSNATYEEVIKKIARKDKTKLTGAEKGTIMHKLVKIIHAKDLDSEFKRLIDLGMFKESELEQIDKGKILKYLSSDLYKRIESSNMVKREMPFMMKMKVDEVYQVDTKALDDVIIQGIVDCIFEEDGKLVILDYKTDRVYLKDKNKEDRIKELKEEYRTQLDLYEKAARQIFGMEIKEKVLYLFDSAECVTL